MKRKLLKIDSLSAYAIFPGAGNKYKELETQINNWKLKQYLPWLDSLSTSLKFLQANPQILTTAKEAKEKLTIVLRKVKGQKQGIMQIDFLYINVDKDAVQFHFADIYYMEAMKRYVKIVTKSKPYLIETSLNKVEALLPPAIFCRIHRSYIISLINTRVIRNEMVLIHDTSLPVGREYRDALLEKVVIITRDVKNRLNPPNNGLKELEVVWEKPKISKGCMLFITGNQSFITVNPLLVTVDFNPITFRIYLVLLNEEPWLL